MVQTGAVTGLAPVGLARLLKKFYELVGCVCFDGSFKGRVSVLIFDVDSLLGRVSEQGPGDLTHAVDLVSPAFDGVVSLGVVSAQVVEGSLIGEVERPGGRWVFGTNVANGLWIAAKSDGRVEDGPTGTVYLRDIFWVGHVDEFDNLEGWVESTGVMQSIVVNIDCAVVAVVAAVG